MSISNSHLSLCVCRLRRPTATRLTDGGDIWHGEANGVYEIRPSFASIDAGYIGFVTQNCLSWDFKHFRPAY